MIQGIYLATQGMTTLLQKQEQIANNLANINTTGFKQSGLFTKAYQKYLSNDIGEPFANREIKADQVFVDYSEGPMRLTKGSLDACINGSGFFSVMTPDGTQYTRNGNFALSPDGFLVTSDGSKVMGTDGYIRVDRNIPIQITDRGEIVQNNDVKGMLKVVDFEKPYRFERTGDSRFRPLLPDNPEVKSAGYLVKQGYLEGSNVNMIRNMVQMIGAYRNYEADSRALQAQDQTLDKAVNQIGSVR